MDAPMREVSWLESFPPDIWACFAWYLSGEQLGRLMITGATLLRQRLKSSNVVKFISLGQDSVVINSWPRLLNYFPSLEKLWIQSCNYEWGYRSGMTFDSIPSGVRKLKLSGDWSKCVGRLFGEPDGSVIPSLERKFESSGYWSGRMAKMAGELAKPLKLSELLPHLESLNLYPLPIPHYTWLVHCPQSLTKLRMKSWDGAVELPSSLIHFEAFQVTLSKRSFVSKLPPMLESYKANTRGSSLLVPLLPPSTRKLYLGTWDPFSDWSPQNLLEQAPRSLTWFVVPDYTGAPELVSLLPPTLTTLVFNPRLPCSAWPLLPQNLTMISFKVPLSLCTVASSMIGNLGVLHEVTSIPFDALPRSITKLELFGSDTLNFCGPPPTSNQSYFPPQLKCLTIPQVQLSLEAAKLLPSSLTQLQIGNLCERVCQHFPVGLKSLTSPTALMSPNLIKVLPRSLTLLKLYAPYPESPWFDHNTGERIDQVSKLPEYSVHEMCVSKGFDWKEYPLPPTVTSVRLPHTD